ncbi:MAG: IPT/TIG domain-containing protein [Bacteroidetes bacterium]|nr:IPT/TIG domain-containing protein [Bacteroidota bacterium]
MLSVRRTFAELFALLSVLTMLAPAQTRTITFTGVKEGSTEAVTPDSIRVYNLTKGRDTLLIGSTTFDIDWLTGVDHTGRLLEDFTLFGGFQDPAGGTTSLHVSLPQTGVLRMTVYSLLGAEVASTSVSLSAGTHLFRLDASGIATGTYIVTASTGRETRALKVSTLRSAASGPARISYGGAVPLPMRKASADMYTFIGHARGCHPDTLSNIEPEAGRSYQFTFTPLPSDGLLTGPWIEVASGDIPPQGGMLTVSTPGTPVTGLQITVPAQSYPEERSFTVSYADILNHGFDEKVTVLSPLITFSNGGGYADSAMLIRIPIRLPAGQYAMAFFYDRDTHSLEGIPIVALTDDAVYVATRHLASDHLGFAKAQSSMRTLRAWIDVLVLGIETEELTGKISTGFTPGVDDWEFINWGSYLTPGGHCTGQSLTAIWYYVNKKLRGAQDLYNQMDKVHADSMWMDNTRGYRFASVVWKGLKWEDRKNWLYGYFQQIGLTKFSVDSLHYLAFAFSMRTTGKPQLTEIWRLDGGWKGHAMIVYETDGGTLRIADPNYPGKKRETRLNNNGSFIPYSSGDNAGNVGKIYPLIQYIANSAIASSGALLERWKQTFDGSIGTVPPDVFPATTLFHVRENEQDALPEELLIVGDTAIVVATCPTCADKLEGDRTPILLTDEQGRFISWSDTDGRLRIPAPPGTITYGLTVYGYSGAGKTGLGYIDFRWLSLTGVKPFISKITPATGKPGDEILIEGTGFGDDRSTGAVTIDGLPMTEISDWSDTAIRVKVPLNAKGGFIVVRRENVESNRKWWLVDVPVTITSVTPLHGHWGDVITVRGTRLNKVMYVRFNGHMSPDMPPNAPGWNDTTIVARVPNNCVEGVITLDITGSVNVVTGPHFTHDTVAIVSADPPAGPVNTIITISGEHFGQAFWPGSQVTVGGVVAETILDWTDTTIKIYGKNSGRIAVTVCGKTVYGPTFTMTL